MKSFTVVTLVDITETKQYRREPGNDVQRHQQQNFQMLLQTIGMRVNPMNIVSPVCQMTDLSTLTVGSNYAGMHRVWTFKFDIEYASGLTSVDGNEAGLLLADLHFVPFTPGLAETFNVEVPVFDTLSPDNRNTVININT